jgi:pimeloyl-ACP methyl ester carboxylesterase
MTALAARLSRSSPRIASTPVAAVPSVTCELPTAALLGLLDEGQGEPIVLVTGAMMAASDWDRVAPHLRQFRFVRYTRRLYASVHTTREMARTHSLARELDDLRAVLDAVGQPVTLVGHSSGAVVALELARRDPERVRRAGVVRAAAADRRAARRCRRGAHACLGRGRQGRGGARRCSCASWCGRRSGCGRSCASSSPAGYDALSAAAQLADVDAYGCRGATARRVRGPGAADAAPARRLEPRAHLREREARLAGVLPDAHIDGAARRADNAESLRPAELGHAHRRIR